MQHSLTYIAIRRSVLDTLHTAFCIILMYYYFIENFGDITAWQNLVWYVHPPPYHPCMRNLELMSHVLGA